MELALIGRRRRPILVVLAIVLIACSGYCSHGLSICKMNDDGIKACRPAVTAPNPAAPSADCCKALSGADLTCLCSYKESPVLPTLGIDPDLCMALPAKCDLQAPSGC